MKLQKKKYDELILKLSNYSAATIHEALNKTGAMDSDIKPIKNSMKLCGRAVTVSCYPKDNLSLHKAIEVSNPGDVIVATMQGFSESGPWGEITSFASKYKGIRGLVIDGSVRDTEEIINLEFPVFSRGSCVKGTLKSNIDVINQPIICAGALVRPGDIVVGNRDGVVVIPSDKAEFVLKNAKKIVEKENQIKEEIKNGKSTLDILGIRKE